MYKDKEKRKKWLENNKEKINEYKKKWKKNYHKKIKNKYGFGCTTIQVYGLKLALKVYEKYNRKCVECGSEFDLTIHHLDHKGRNYIRKGLKPNNDINNLILICRKCHGSIHGKEGGRGRVKNPQIQW